MTFSNDDIYIAFKFVQFLGHKKISLTLNILMRLLKELFLLLKVQVYLLLEIFKKQLYNVGVQVCA